MTRLEALTELRDKVAAGENLFGADCMIAPLMNWPAYTEHSIWKASHGSLDAAKALHEAVLPDAPAQLTDMRPYRGSGGWLVSINWNKDKHQAGDADLARAWLLAIIRTLLQDPSILASADEIEKGKG